MTNLLYAFFYWTEWIPVIVAALAVGTLAVLVARRPTRGLLRFGYGVLGLQLVTGLLGAGLHLLPLLETEVATTGLWDALRYGPPVFVPLLFVDLSVLAALGLWDFQAKLDLSV